jgi:DNA-binding MarR family transcriptional regulator
MNYDDQLKKNFFAMVDSLKKSRRADLSDINDDDNIIERLYTDPLHSNLILESCLKPNTTILIGRKGTGKSTIIARLQHEIRKSTDKLSIYIDVKNVFDQSKPLAFDSEEYKGIMKEEELEKYLLTKTFLTEILKEIKKEVKTNTLRFFLAKVTSIFGPDKKKFENEVEQIFEQLHTDQFNDISVLRSKGIVKSNADETTDTTTSKVEGDLKYANNLTGNIKGSFEKKKEIKGNENLQVTFSEVLLRYFNPSEIIENIKGLLTRIGIKYVFICLDDFSEIDEDAMRVFVNTIVAPLNNWSNEFFKFKIAAYPNRYYLGEIDPTKIDQIKLDYYDLYSATRVSDTEKEAAENIKRLLDTRSEYFCGRKFEYFIDPKQSPDDFYTILFNTTSNVPRNIGWILWYANQYSVSKGRGITIRDLELSAERYYIDSIDPFFSQNLYMKESFNEKLGKLHLRTLLNNMIAAARKNKTEIGLSDSKIWQKDRTNPPTSHFYIKKEYEEILQSLELNFFITKYNEQKDQDSKELMSFYSLNYGLCSKENIIYGKGSDRKYIIQRRFNYNSLIEEFLNNTKSIVCNYCGKAVPPEQREILKIYGMLCPNCRIGTCEEKHVEVEVPSASEDILLPELDLSILNALRIEQPQYASQLAQELDCTYHKITKRVNSLEIKGLISRKRENREAGNRTYYYLTEYAYRTYFNEFAYHQPIK